MATCEWADTLTTCSTGKMSGGRIPFEQLPNLPKPHFKPIDLGITRTEVSAIE